MRLMAFLFLAGVFMASCVSAMAQEDKDSYYRGNTSVQLTISDAKIVAQFDSTVALRNLSEFFALHPCLNSVAGRKYIARGFYEYQLSQGYGYQVARTDLLSDEIVSRVVPVYLT